MSEATGDTARRRRGPPHTEVNSDPQAPGLPVQGQKSLPAPYSHIALTALTIPVWGSTEPLLFFSQSDVTSILKLHFSG